jgi:hypothetical protein
MRIAGNTAIAKDLAGSKIALFLSEATVLVFPDLIGRSVRREFCHEPLPLPLTRRPPSARVGSC